jgi:hypothetical protein
MSPKTRETAPGESILSRWSKRKLEAEQTAAIDDDLSTQEADSSADAVIEETVAEAPALTDADMPDIDSLGEDSDFSQFMSPGVSEELRNLALRKLFHAPVFNIRDGLDEYDEDYTSFEKLGDIVTSDMKHQVEVQQQKLRERQQQQREDEENAELEAAEAVEDEENAELEAAEAVEDEDAATISAEEVPVTEAADDADDNNEQKTGLQHG